MKIVLQRVHSASVSVGNEVVGKIDKGYVIFFGAGKGDTKAIALKLADKISRLRIFADENGKTNLSSHDVGGQILIVSQFTLLADCTQKRPSFSNAAPADLAKELYEYFTECCRERFCHVQNGRFAAHMEVSCINDGPFTLVLEG